MIAIIPARGGSKGLPGKNIKPLLGKPLIAYTIEAALKSRCITRVVVTTDSAEIADTAKAFGAEVPFLRPAELATDTASAIDVYLHTIDYLKEKDNIQADKFLVLLPTAPFRTELHIDEAVGQFYNSKAETLISVCKAETPPGWYLLQEPDGMIKNAGFGVNTAMENRQKNAVYFVPNGAIYLLDYELLKVKRTYYSQSIPYVMDKNASVDIDTKDDFEYAEYLMKRQREI